MKNLEIQNLIIEPTSFSMNMDDPIEIYNIEICAGCDSEYLAGRMKVQYLNLSNPDDTYFDIFDSDGILNGAYTELFQGMSDHLKYEIECEFEEPGYSNMLFIDKIQVYPDFRGYKLGLKAIYCAIERLGRECSYVILKAFPLQFEDKNRKKDEQWNELMDPEYFEQNQEIAQQKLIAHYAKLGFRQINNSSYMLLNRDLKQPELNFSS